MSKALLKRQNINESSVPDAKLFVEVVDTFSEADVGDGEEVLLMFLGYLMNFMMMSLPQFCRANFRVV